MMVAFVRRAGFTLVELMIVIAILAILTTVGAPFLANSVGKNELKTTAWEMADTLRRAQSQTMAGNGSTGWGVHFESTQYVFFQGATYNAADPDNITAPLSPSLSIDSIALNGGGTEVLFTSKKGVTGQYGDIQITDAGNNTVSTVTVTAAGVISYAL